MIFIYILVFRPKNAYGLLVYRTLINKKEVLLKTNNSQNNSTDKILRLPDVKAFTGLSRSSIYLYIKAASFPPPIKIGKRSVGWLESDIQEWIESCKGGAA